METRQDFDPPPEPQSLVDLSKEAQTLIDEILAAKKAAFFEQPSSPNKIVPLDESNVAKLEKLLAASRFFMVEGSSAESAFITLQILRKWNEFSGLVKSNKPDKASVELPAAREQQPENLPATYVPIWEGIAAWEQTFINSYASYQEHMKRGKSLADLGKISEAIREYNEAFALFEDPAIAAEVKRLRNSTLGL